MVITIQSYLSTILEYCKNYSVDMEVFLVDFNKLVFISGKEKRTISEKCRRNVTDKSVAIMLHTSGTTSDPKKVMLSHQNLIANIESNIASLELNENDKTLIVLPMYFGYHPCFF